MWGSQRQTVEVAPFLTEQIEKEISTYRQAFESTAADRDRLSGELALMSAERDEYKHAFESTAVDRDRIAEELAALRQERNNYKLAFEGTAEDRDAFRLKLEIERAALTGVLDHPRLVSEFLSRPSKPLAPPQRADDLLRSLIEAVPDPEFSPDLSRFEDGLAQSSRLPNLYCVGAPKSVTSYFYSILREHPKVFVCEKDTGEITDLALAVEHGRSDLPELTTRLLEAANRNYAAKYAGQPVMGLFEVGYLSHVGGAAFIKKHLAEDPLVLIFLRDPVKRMLSEYVMRVRQYDREVGGFVERNDLSEALLLEPSRAMEDWVVGKSYYGYAANSQYFQPIQSYFDTFGPERVKVLIAEEDVYRKLPQTILDIFRFLGLQDHDAIRLAFADHSAFAAISRSPKTIGITFTLADGRTLDDTAGRQQLLSSPVVRLDITSDVPSQLNLSLPDPTRDDILAALELRRRHAVKLSTDQEARLFERHFREDVVRLEELIQRDLSCWYARYQS